MIRSKQYSIEEAKKDPIGIYYQYIELHNRYHMLLDSSEMKLVTQLKEFIQETKEENETIK